MRFQQVRAPFSSNASNARVSHSVRRLRGSLQVGCRLMCRRGDAGLTRAWLAQVDLSRRACRHRTLCPNHAQSSSASNRRGTLAAVPGRQRILSCHLQTLRKETAPPSPRPQDQNLCLWPFSKVPVAGIEGTSRPTKTGCACWRAFSLDPAPAGLRPKAGYFLASPQALSKRPS